MWNWIVNSVEDKPIRRLIAPYERELIHEGDDGKWHQLVSHDVKFSKWLIDQPLHEWSRIGKLTFLVSDNLYTIVVLKWG